MHQPPDIEWLQRFSGAVVDTVTFCRYQIVICLEDARHITFSGFFRFAPSAEVSAQEWTEFPLRESSMLRLLGASIADIRTDAENQLWIDFSSGDTLIVAWTPMYECYEFTEDGKRVII